MATVPGRTRLRQEVRLREGRGVQQSHVSVWTVSCAVGASIAVQQSHVSVCNGLLLLL